MAVDDQGLALLKTRLAEAERTIDTLVRRVEEFQSGVDLQSVFPLLKTIAGLEDVVEARSRDLEESEDLFRTLFTRSPDMLLLVRGQQGHIEARNDAASGLGEGDKVEDFFEDQEAVRQLLRRSFVGAGDSELRLRDGRSVLMSARSIGEKAAQHYQLVLRDVTAYRLLVEELQLSRRLAAVGNLAAGVAHEINNPLAVVLGRIELLQALGTSDPVAQQRHLDLIRVYARRIALTVRNLQVFSRPGLGARETLPIERLLESAQIQVSERLGEVTVRVETHPVDLEIRADPVLMEQVVSSLIVEQVDLQQRRGRLEILALEIEGRCRICLRQAPATRGAYPGAQPGVTWVATEAAEDRLGFGVAVASVIVREHGGQLMVPEQGSPGRGGFLVDLPLQDSLESPAASESGPTRTLDILLVEDDPGMRVLAEDMLRAAGHHISSVASSEEALLLLADRNFDALVSDVNLPGLSGIALREAAGARWPGLERRVILVTGLDLQAPHGVQLLRKPFTQLQLLEALENILEEPG